MDFKSEEYENIEAFVKDKPLVISTKIDGVLNGLSYSEGKAYFATREGRITEELPVTKEISKLLGSKQETILFGELYGVDADGKELPLNETVSITRKPKSSEDENRIKFGVFDIYKYDGKLVEENDYWKRLLLIQELFENGTLVHPVYAKNEDGSSAIKSMWEEEVIGKGHEGIVLHIEGDTVKIKPTKSVDALVIAVKPNLEKGFISSLFLALMDKDGVYRSTSFVGTGLKEEERIEWLTYANENRAIAPNHDELIWIDISKTPRIVEVDYERPIVKETESFEFANGEWKQLEEERLSATLIKPRFIRLREDKKVNENDLRLIQIPDLEKELTKKSFSLDAYKLQDILGKYYGRFDTENTLSFIINQAKDIINLELSGVDILTKLNSFIATSTWDPTLLAATLKLYKSTKPEEFDRQLLPEQRKELLAWAENILQQYDTQTKKSFKIEAYKLYDIISNFYRKELIKQQQIDDSELPEIDMATILAETNYNIKANLLGYGLPKINNFIRLYDNDPVVAAAHLKFYRFVKPVEFSALFSTENEKELLDWAENTLQQPGTLVKKSFKVIARYDYSAIKEHEDYHKNKGEGKPKWLYEYMDRAIPDWPLGVGITCNLDLSTFHISFNDLITNLDKLEFTNYDVLKTDIDRINAIGEVNAKRLSPAGGKLSTISEFTKEDYKYVKSFKLQAYYPKHPNTIIFPKSEFVRYPLTESSVWQYYDKVKDKIIQQTRGKNVLLYLRVNGDILKRKHDGVVRIDNYNDFNRLNSGRLVEIHVESCQEKRDTCLTDVIFCDIDPKENFGWKETKEVAKKVYNIFNKDSNVKKVTMKYSGGRGLHIFGHLRESWEVDRAREYTKSLLRSLENDKIKLGIVREQDMLRLDTTLLKRRGSLRAAYSLNKTTGLVAVPIDIKTLGSFEKKDATIKKVLEKLGVSKKSFKLLSYKLQDILGDYYKTDMTFNRLESIIDSTEGLLKSQFMHKDIQKAIEDIARDWLPKDVLAAQLKLYKNTNPDQFSRFFTPEREKILLYWAESTLRQYDQKSKKSFKLCADEVIAGKWGVHQDEIEVTEMRLSHEKWFGDYLRWPNIGRAYDRITRGVFIITPEKVLQIRIYKDTGIPDEALDKSNRLLDKIGHRNEYKKVEFYMVDNYSSSRVAIKFIISRNASILDYPKPGLEPKVWNFDGTINVNVKSQILNKLNKFIDSQGYSAKEIINKIYVVGSLTSYQYNKLTDLDIHIYLNLQNMLGIFQGDEADLIELIDKSWRKTLNKAESENIGGTQHPLEFYFEIPEDLSVAPSDGVYDLLNDTWIKEPKVITVDFAVEKIYPEIINNAKEIAKELDIQIGELKRDVTDAEMIKDLIDYLSEEQKGLFVEKLNTKIEEIDNNIVDLLKVEQNISDKRHEDYAWDSEGNILFKYLQRFGYVGLLKSIEKAIGNDKKFDTDDIENTQRVLSPIKSFRLNAYKLYLDDERFPKSEGWNIVRTLPEFISIIQERGLPTEISFDHDLGPVETGYMAAKWLVDNEYDLRKISINVHSANPIGRDNIYGIINSWNNFLDKKKNAIKLSAFTPDPNSTENEMRWRLIDPQAFDKDSFRRWSEWAGVKAPEGITFLVGDLKKEKKKALQAIRFDKASWLGKDAGKFWNKVKNKKGFEKTWEW